MPPVALDGDLLVDGGVVNNLPVDIMQARRDGRTIAVNLRSLVTDARYEAFDPTTSGWQVLASRVLPGRSPIRAPSAAAMMLRVKDLGRAQAHERCLALADLVLDPPVDGVDTLDFRSARPLIESSYRYACGALEAWLRDRSPA
jgi:predicted acylesterase/phospholipase RssA